MMPKSPAFKSDTSLRSSTLAATGRRRRAGQRLRSVRMGSLTAPAVGEVGYNHRRGISQDANQRRHRIVHAAVELLEREYEHRTERAHDLRRERRGAAATELRG